MSPTLSPSPLSKAIGVAFSEVDLAREGPRGVHALRRLLAAAGASGSLSKLLPVAVLDGRVLGEAGEPGGGARNLIELHDGGELRPLLRDLPSPRPEPRTLTRTIPRTPTPPALALTLPPQPEPQPEPTPAPSPNP